MSCPGMIKTEGGGLRVSASQENRGRTRKEQQAMSVMVATTVFTALTATKRTVR